MASQTQSVIGLVDAASAPAGPYYSPSDATNSGDPTSQSQSAHLSALKQLEAKKQDLRNHDKSLQFKQKNLIDHGLDNLLGGASTKHEDKNSHGL